MPQYERETAEERDSREMTEEKILMDIRIDRAAEARERAANDWFDRWPPPPL